jgi:hypothetical protein
MAEKMDDKGRVTEHYNDVDEKSGLGKVKEANVASVPLGKITTYQLYA